MEGYLFLFYTSAVVGALFFGFSRRRFDLFSVAFFSAIIYFLPGFLGIDAFEKALEPKVYLIFSIVLFSIYVWGVGYDALWHSNKHKIDSERSFQDVRSFTLFTPFLYTSNLIILCLLVLTYGPTVFFLDKNVLQLPFYFEVPWRTISSMTVIVGLVTKRRGLFAMGFLSSLLAFLSQDRTGPTMTLIASLLIMFHHHPRVRLILAYWKVSFPTLLVGVILIYGKILYSILPYVIQTGDWQNALTLSGGAIINTKLHRLLEPFTTQAILNAIVRTNFQINDNYLNDFIFQLFPSAASLGYPSSVFNDIFQGKLFPFAGYGLAYNYWGEAIALGGWVVLTWFLLIYLFGLSIVNTLMLRSKNYIFLSMYCLVGAYLAFYIHRNSLYSIFAYIKQVLYITLPLLFLSWLLYKLLSVSKKSSSVESIQWLQAPKECRKGGGAIDL